MVFDNIEATFEFDPVAAFQFGVTDNSPIS